MAKINNGVTYFLNMEDRLLQKAHKEAYEQIKSELSELGQFNLNALLEIEREISLREGQ